MALHGRPTPESNLARIERFETEQRLGREGIASINEKIGKLSGDMKGLRAYLEGRESLHEDQEGRIAALRKETRFKVILSKAVVSLWAFAGAFAFAVAKHVFDF